MVIKHKHIIRRVSHIIPPQFPHCSSITSPAAPLPRKDVTWAGVSSQALWLAASLLGWQWFKDMYLPFPSGSSTMDGLAQSWGLGLYMIVEELSLRRFMFLTTMGSGQSSIEQAEESSWTLPLAWRVFVIGQSWMVSCHPWLHRSLTYCCPGSSSRAHWGELLITEKPWPHIRSRGFVASARCKVLCL